MKILTLKRLPTKEEVDLVNDLFGEVITFNLTEEGEDISLREATSLEVKVLNEFKKLLEKNGE